MENQQKAKRIINTLTGPWEKRNLPKMAAALPRWVTSDHLTILGIIAAFVISLGYILTWYSTWWLMLANFGFLLHWWADSLDGTLARVRHTEREQYGYFVDHICDAFSTVIILVAFGFSPLMRLDVGLFLIIGYLMLNIYTHVGAYSKGIFRLSYAKFGPTEVRILVVLVNTLLVFWNPVIFNLNGNSWSVVDVAGGFIAGLFFIVFVIVSIIDAIKLDRLDRAKRKAAEK
ncbi:MAG: CDP-alcohol phosphatidyltransferase [Candidatus Marinimicrobia bacterium CG08_land_8_20_14_0_20_45_22]|nr:MAG: CDP-alcohol phosphatidyltransferase [Candidatus Marinimicrobia bacterium CG08_land_8_20_14_0_20_45_22]